MKQSQELNYEVPKNELGVRVSKVIIVAGFLGAGKTTLIETILKAPQLSRRVAVI